MPRALCGCPLARYTRTCEHNQLELSIDDMIRDESRRKIHFDLVARDRAFPRFLVALDELIWGEMLINQGCNSCSCYPQHEQRVASTSPDADNLSATANSRKHKYIM